MATCQCGAETSRLTVVLRDKGREEFCPRCRPEAFERWQDPSNKHGGFRWQYEPQKYIKRNMPDGSVFYEATDERNADLEAQLMAPNLDEEARKQQAIEAKRASRRTTPLTADETSFAVERARRKLAEASSLAI